MEILHGCFPQNVSISHQHPKFYGDLSTTYTQSNYYLKLG